MEKLQPQDSPDTADVSVRLLAGILNVMHEQDAAGSSSVVPLEHVTSHTSSMMKMENDELKARICALEAQVMELESQVGDKTTKISEVEALYALEKAQFQALATGHISENKELQDTVVRLQNSLEKGDKGLPAASVRAADSSGAVGVHVTAMITDKVSRILSIQSSIESSLSAIATQQGALRAELHDARTDAVRAVAQKKEVELHVGKLRETIRGLRSTLLRKELHIGDLTKSAKFGALHLDRSRVEHAEMANRGQYLIAGTAHPTQVYQFA